MQYIIPKDDTTTLSNPERTFLRNAARGTLSSNSKLLRLDGRKPSESRPIRLSFTRCHNRSECVVQFASGTRSAASVRAELVPPPNADKPNDGQVKFSVDVGPMASMGYEVVDRPVSNYSSTEAVDGGQMGSGGGGGDNAPYLQKLKSNRILRILERTLLIGGAMDAEALCVQSGVWVWRLHVDVSLLDDGGNALDACILAAVAALRHYRLPEVNIGGGDGDGDTDEVTGTGGYQETTIIHSDDREPTPLPLHHTPLTATFALFADESGTTTSVSALLDPYDREELACDGLLTWSYNKYGEMCCLDFPGGCELRPRQLMASAKLGKRRCVEICELLETALDEAEGKAQKERMDRLKNVNANRPSITVDNAATAAEDESMDVDHESQPPNDQTDKEEEAYRKIALDYSSGHIAASVKEDKDKKSSQKNTRTEPSSLFNAILRSAQSSNTNNITSEKKGETITTSFKDNNATVQQKKEPDVEIVVKEPLEKGKAVKPSIAAVDNDEEEVVQLTTEFSTMKRDREDSEETGQTDIAAETSMPMETEPTQQTEKTDVLKTNIEVKKSKPKSKPAVAAEEDDITDLSQALKKKKKKSKKSKK